MWKQHSSRLLKLHLSWSLAALVSAPVMVSASERRADAGVNFGFGPHANRYGIQFDIDLVDRPLSRGDRWTASFEAGLSRWHPDREGQQRAWQISGVPFLRLWSRKRRYLELGVGAGIFSEHSIGKQQLGSHFQFCNHLGGGVELRGKHRFGVRLSHFSNGGLADPNDGLDVWQVIYSRDF